MPCVETPSSLYDPTGRESVGAREFRDIKFSEINQIGGRDA
jgi:hypothetical protein